MAAKDIYHPHVRTALEKEQWIITHDPFSLKWTGTTLQIDLGAERLLAAEKGTTKIAVEVKSFVSRSRIDDLENALGQLVLYRHLLRKSEPDRTLFLAVSNDIYQSFLSQPQVELLLREENICLLIFDPQAKEVCQWINWNDTATSSNKP